MMPANDSVEDRDSLDREPNDILTYGQLADHLAGRKKGLQRDRRDRLALADQIARHRHRFCDG